MVSNNLSLQVNGRVGQNGAGGASGGRDGGPAGRPTAGSDAGSIDLFRCVDPQNPDHVIARARCMAPGAAPQDVSEVLAPGASVSLSATGGAGGAGGTGGHGAHGQDGARGRDAFMSSPGTNGGDGTDGGNGGAGTDGAAGGRGGTIIDRVPGVDTDLFAASSWNVAGGSGGAAGHHGTPGRGGRGGSGGSSTSYSETIGYIDGMPQTTTRYVPGGSRGRDGRSGSAPGGGLSSGGAGSVGRLELIIADGPDQGTYPDRYHVNTIGFGVAGTDGQRFTEFGGAMTGNATVQNSGSMPTPYATDLTVGIVPGMWVQPQARVPLPRGMRPGDNAHLEGLDFNIPWPRFTPGEEPYVQNTSVGLGFEMARLGLFLQETTPALPLCVQFPLRLAAFEVDTVAYSGKPANARWTLVNISDRNVGGTARPAQTVLRLAGGDAVPDLVRFDGDNGATGGDLSQALVTALPSIAPGEELTLTGKFHFASDAEPYSQAKVVQAIALAPPGGGELMPVQERAAGIQLAQSYLGRDDASAILLVNHKTDRAEIDAWKEVLAAMGTRADIWNVSVYGTDTLQDVFADRRFANTCRNKTLVALNSAYSGKNQANNLARTFERGDLLGVAARAGAATYIVGPGARIEPQRLLPPVAQNTMQHGSINKFKAAIAANTAAVLRPCSTDVIDVRSNRRKPQAKHLRNKVAKLLEVLSSDHPERNYAATYSVNIHPHPAGSNKRNHLGTVTLQRALDTTQHVATALPVSDDRLHSPAFIRSEENRLAFCRTLPFTQKLVHLRQAAMTGNMAVIGVWLRAIDADLADEQAMLRKQASRGHLGRHEIRARMQRLGALAADPWLCSNPQATLLANHIHDVVTSQLRAEWYEHLRPWHRRNVDVDAVTEALLENIPASQIRGRVLSSLPANPQGMRTEFDSFNAQV